MKLLWLTTLLLSASAQPATEKRCRGVYFSDRYYDIEILKEGLNHVKQLALNKNDNTVYFIFEELSETSTTAAGYYNLTSNDVGVIDVKNATSLAIDQQYNKVYIGAQDGVYRLNNRRNIERLPVRDDVQHMYFKDVLFYTNGRNEARMYDNGHINEVFELTNAHPQKIVLDDDHNILYTEEHLLFRVRLGTRIVNTHETLKTNVLTTDADYKPYIVTNDGIYTYNKYKYVFDKVSDLRGLKALTFDRFGDPIYVVADFLIRLKHNPNRCFEPIV